jgi:hypothetical protein
MGLDRRPEPKCEHVYPPEPAGVAREARPQVAHLQVCSDLGRPQLASKLQPMLLDYPF